MITYYYKTIKEKDLLKIPEIKPGIWVDCFHLENSDIKNLTKYFPLQPQSIKDALDIYEVPRLELEEGIAYIFTRAPYIENEQIPTIPLLIAVSKDYIFTISDEKLKILDIFRENRTRFYTTQKVKFLIQIFQEINNSYDVVLADIERRIRNITFKIEKIDSKDIVQFVKFESILNDFHSALVSNNFVLNNVLSGKHLKLYKEDEDLIEDLFFSNEQLIKRSKLLLKHIVETREAYSTIITNNLNKVIKFLTAVTIIITIPTMISSFYGMNIKLPLSNSDYAFLIIMAATITSMGVITFIFNNKKWL